MKCLVCGCELDEVMQKAVDEYGIEPHCSYYCGCVDVAGIPGSDVDVVSKYDELNEKRKEEEYE